MNPARYDITIYQGATFERSLQLKDSNGVPLNMSGYTVSGTLWNRTGTTKLADFELPWENQASGVIGWKVAASVTSGITEQGQYDILVTEPSGDKFYLLEGNAFCNLGFTGRE